MKKFTDRGLPIILGEYGALYRLQLTGDELTEHKKSRSYYLEYITEAAIRHGMVPFYWDNGAPDFVLISRSSNQVVHPDALQAIMKSRL